SISVTAITFPDYESDSSAPIKMYLNGELGLIDDVNVYAASSFYSIDRYISFKTKWRKSYEDGNIILADR
ncbi:MAG: thymidylate kinase, partial [Oscillospiraceae bacterium]